MQAKLLQNEVFIYKNNFFYSIDLVNLKYSRVPGSVHSARCIQLFRETLSEKVHATIPKGIVGSFEFTVLHEI